jgi:voltage-gated potassium channel Kch
MNLTIYGVSLFTVIMISSTLMYFAEGENEGTLFTSIPQAMWWSVVTITTVGYGDMYPVTVGGRIVAAVTMFAGLCLFAVLFNVVGKVLMVALFGEGDLDKAEPASTPAAPAAAARAGNAGSCACGRGLDADWRLCPHCGLLVT